jgi:hypothetical protein
MNPDDLREMTLEQLSKITRRSPVTLRMWARRRQLPARKIGKTYVVSIPIFLASLTDGSLAACFSVREAAEIRQKLEQPVEVLS